MTKKLKLRKKPKSAPRKAEKPRKLVLKRSAVKGAKRKLKLKLKRPAEPKIAPRPMPEYYRNLPEHIQRMLTRIPHPPNGVWIVREFQSLDGKSGGGAYTPYVSPIEEAPTAPTMERFPISWAAGELGRILSWRNQFRCTMLEYMRVFPDKDKGLVNFIVCLHYIYTSMCHTEKRFCEFIASIDPEYAFPVDVENYPHLASGPPEYEKWFKKHASVVSDSSSAPVVPSELSKKKLKLMKKKKLKLLKREH